MTHGDNGATIEEMRTDYFNMVGERWPLKCCGTDSIVSYLNQIDGLMMEKLDDGLCIWYIDDIGSNLSDRQMDSNNNINVAGQSDTGGDVRNNSDGSVDRRQTTSFVSGNTGPTLSTTTTTTSSETVTLSSAASTEAFEQQNDRESDKLKRRLSHNSSCPHDGKRQKSNEADPTKQMPLIEQNLNLHNWNSGANGVMKQVTTSTEKENSMLVLNGVANGVIDVEEIEVGSVSDYQAPIKDTEMKQLQK